MLRERSCQIYVDILLQCHIHIQFYCLIQILLSPLKLAAYIFSAILFRNEMTLVMPFFIIIQLRVGAAAAQPYNLKKLCVSFSNYIVISLTLEPTFGAVVINILQAIAPPSEFHSLCLASAENVFQISWLEVKQTVECHYSDRYITLR